MSSNERVLVLAEHGAGRLCITARQAVSAARQLGGEVHVLLVGDDCAAAASEAASLHGVAAVKVAEAAHYAVPRAEDVATLMLAHAGDYTHIMAADSTFGRNTLPRVAALLGVEQVSGVTGIVSADTFVRPIHAGNALLTVRSDDPVKVLTIRPTAFAPADDGDGEAAVEIMTAPPAMGMAELLERQVAASVAGAAGVVGTELGSARVVVAGGRGLGSAENFTALLKPLADRLGAALGASYGAVSAGYATNEMQIGQTGRIVAPRLYLAVGISGAIQHLAGIKDAECIVAIDRDPEAPIFKVADYGLVADLCEAVPALMRALDALDEKA